MPMPEAGPAQPRIEAIPSPDDPNQLNISQTLAHNLPLRKAFVKFGGHLLGSGVLPPRERELVILRAGWRCGSEYEFGQHTLIGRDAGLTDAEIARLAEAGAGGWSEQDQTLVDMVDELCRNDVISEATWHRLKTLWNDEEVHELLLLAGFYRMVSGLLNSAGVAIESFTPGWPAGAEPQRRAPRSEKP
jgi:alkylhydroperoxidase family enzyme